MLNIVQGNLLTAKDKYIVHQCNAISTAAAHLAKDVFAAFPYADIYSPRKSQSNLTPTGNDLPGNIKVRGDGINQRYIINLLGQYYPGSPRFPNSNLDGHKTREKYFYQCLLEIAKMKDLESIGFPYKIGCGAAGGNWKYYLATLHNFSNYIKNVKVNIYCLTQQDFNNAKLDYQPFQK